MLLLFVFSKWSKNFRGLRCEKRACGLQITIYRSEFLNFSLFYYDLVFSCLFTFQKYVRMCCVCRGMLADAVLPPSEDHMYAQWREKPEPAEGSLDLSGGKSSV